MTAIDEEATMLWNLLTELSAELSANREHCETLKNQCSELKKKAIHTGTGFALKRLNVDITQERFESELERYNATLVLDNQALQFENKQLSIILKDYETGLDSIMAKFRGFAASTQQFELDSARHYESLLMQQAESSSVANGVQQSSIAIGDGATILPLLAHTSQEPLAFQMSLSHLSSMLRKALRSLQGEDDEDSSSSEEEQQSSDEDEDELDGIQRGNQSRNQRQASILSKRSSEGGSTTTRATKVSSRRRSNKVDSKLDSNEGGYLRLVSEGLEMDRADKALERDTELVRLEKENRELRELLGIHAELPSTL